MTDLFHTYQYDTAKELGGSILNVGCKEDPANISECSEDVTNLDFLKYDVFSQKMLKEVVSNFVQADFRTWENNRLYDVVVLGEFLEHCTVEISKIILKKCSRVLRKGGKLVLTTPFDPRKKEWQHGKDMLFDWDVGITTHHQTLITVEMLYEWLFEADFKILEYKTAPWFDNKKYEGVENSFHHLILAERL